MKKFKQELLKLSNNEGNKRRKSNSNAILLFIAQATAETNANVKWMMLIFTIAAAAGLAVLFRMAFG